MKPWYVVFYAQIYRNGSWVYERKDFEHAETVLPVEYRGGPFPFTKATSPLGSRAAMRWGSSPHTLPYTVSAHFPMDHRIEMRLMAVFFFSGKSLPFFRKEASNELPLRETNIFVFFLTRIGFVCSQNVKKDKCGVKFLFKLSIALRCGI